jgi:hypothetical protein
VTQKDVHVERMGLSVPRHVESVKETDVLIQAVRTSTIEFLMILLIETKFDCLILLPMHIFSQIKCAHVKI